MNKKKIGLIIGILIATIIAIIPFEGLSKEAQMCLALTFMTVTFWAFQISQPGYISGLFLALLVILKVAEPTVIFYSWTGATMYLIIGAYLIATAVKDSGLGERIAYWFILTFMHSYKSMIISIFGMTFVLSLIIPHPWPRSFLIMSVVAEVIENAKIPKQDAIKIGFSVFAASVPVSLIFLTGDSTINPLVVQYAGVEIGWFGWLKIMGIPAIFASTLTCIALLLMFRPSAEINIDKVAIKERLDAMGKLNQTEIRAIVWLVIAVFLWATDSIHGIDIGWITLIIAMLMAMPVIGELLTPTSWGEVPVHVLMFITAAMAIGKVGAVTGMNNWISETLLPGTIPGNPFMLSVLVALNSVVIHMLLGSVIAVMGVAIPALLVYTEALNINPLVVALWVYTAIMIHYIFPFQNMSILVGQGEENGMYSQKETISFSIPLLIIVFVIVALVEVPWWKFTGLL